MLQKKHIIAFYKLYYPKQCNTTSLPIILQLILINNGSLTQNLNSITGQKIYIHLIKQQIKNNRQIIRKVWIKKNTKKLAFAESCWNQQKIDIMKFIANQPIGQSIILDETDIYKEIEYIQYGYYYYLEKTFQIKTPLWHRQYTIWLDKKTLTVIQEFFSISFPLNSYFNFISNIH